MGCSGLNALQCGGRRIFSKQTIPVEKGHYTSIVYVK